MIFIYVMRIVTIYIATHTKWAILNLRMQHNFYYSNALYACLTRSKGKQCGFSKNYRKGTLAIFSQRAIISRGDKIAESLFITYIETTQLPETRIFIPHLIFPHILLLYSAPVHNNQKHLRSQRPAHTGK